MTAPAWSPDLHQPDVKLKAIAFLDCCGYSIYTRLNGDLAAVDLHLRMRHTVEREAGSTHVDVVKWMGDGAMLAAETSDHILACIYRTMISAREAGLLPLRAGMAYGPVAEVAQETVDYFGACVNRAASLCSAARPWQLRADTGHHGEMMHFTLLSAHTAGAQPPGPARPVRCEPAAVAQS